MKLLKALVAVALVLVLSAAASPASATDLCISSPILPASPIVGKGFLVPSRNTCKPFHGFSSLGMAVGTGCTTADGEILRLHFTVHEADHDFVWSAACNFVLPSMTTGNCRTMQFLPGEVIPSATPTDAVATRCTAQTVP